MLFHTEKTSIGRIVSAEVPAGAVVFYTTLDFPGRLDESGRKALGEVIAERLGKPAAFASCHQVHGTDVAQVVSLEAGGCEFNSCDALFTADSAVALGIKVADCLPITIVDSDHRIIANIHSGWRGAVKNIVSRTVAELRRKTQFDPMQSLVFLGPSIRSCCFEVGEEVVEQLSATYGNLEPLVDRSRARPHVDLVALTRSILLEQGVAATAIADSGLCTRCDGSIFHSYRRGASRGRNLAIVAQ